MERRDIQIKRLESAKTRAENYLKSEFKNMLEHTFGEEFYQLALEHGMSNRYQQSLKIKIDGLNAVIELDYEGENGEPLGLWFEEGTKEHFIEPKQKEALHWLDSGVSRFSKGHRVSGIEATHIIKQTIERGKPKMKKLISEKLDEWQKRDGMKWT